MQIAKKTSVIDNQSDGETNDESLDAASVSNDPMDRWQAKDVVPPFSNQVDGIMWSDPLDDRIGNDLLCDRFISEKLPENFLN
ncbi:hypothetical protein [Microcoleus sp. F4-D5]|uniref:hypothetical protein n=1 Tax=Microcoleus sp. F4-D5 TaxID=2818760 RepID=UPI002FD342AB